MPILQDKKALSACGGEIKDSECFASVIYRGERVYFCTQACLRAFEADPERFMAGEIEHPLEEE
ncbi:MAG: YHS domain-containing protein [Chloroflexi bacterium]|nr:YHS domain-containing protein [Chloroflexota bacterium]